MEELMSDENNNYPYSSFNQPMEFSPDDHMMLIKPKLIINNRKKRIVRKSKVDIVRTEKQVLRNERERVRKARLNRAFNVLRRTLPSSAEEECYKSQENKYTQLEVLKFASFYISQLTQLLDSLPDENIVR